MIFTIGLTDICYCYTGSRYHVIHVVMFSTFTVYSTAMSIILFTILAVIAALISRYGSRDITNRQLPDLTHIPVIDQSIIDTMRSFVDKGSVVVDISVDIPVTEQVPETVVIYDELEYTNISRSKEPMKWRVCQHKHLPAPSTAEQIIIDILNTYQVRWYREVEFEGLSLTGYSYPRYDFYIPSITLCIEYDGKMAHSTPHQKALDRVKNKFCKDNNIRIVRYNAKHYYKMEECIAQLMREYKIRKR